MTSSVTQQPQPLCVDNGAGLQPAVPRVCKDARQWPIAAAAVGDD